MKIIQFAHLLFLSGMAAGLTMASPALATTTPNGTKSSATEAVKGTINELIQVLDDETLKQPEQAEERRHEIEEIIKHRVDYEEMARRALGPPGPRFPIGTSTSSSTSSCNSFETHLWAASPNIPTIKWYFWGSFGRMSLL
jgi:hypothetical protein